MHWHWLNLIAALLIAYHAYMIGYHRGRHGKRF